MTIFASPAHRAAAPRGHDPHAAAGGLAFLPKELPHAYRVLEDDTHMLTLCTPAGLEGFFRGAGHNLAAPLPEDWLLGPAQFAPVAAAHGITLLGPPPTA